MKKKSFWKHHYAKLNDVHLHYVSMGQGELILFLHGFPEFWYAWKNQLLEFSKSYFIVCPDMRGYNLSSKPAKLEQYKMELLIKDVKHFVESLGYQKLILVGHDWGGIIAWYFAMYYPEYLEKLVIINAPHPTIFSHELSINPAQQKASQYTIMFRNPEAENILSANNFDMLLNKVLKEVTATGIFTQEDIDAYLEAWSQPHALTGGLNYYRAAHLGLQTSKETTEDVFGFDTKNRLIEVPTLVIWGEKDTALLASNLDGLEKYVKNLTIKRIPDGSHWVIHEKPELVNTYIREFIK